MPETEKQFLPSLLVKALLLLVALLGQWGSYSLGSLGAGILMYFTNQSNLLMSLVTAACIMGLLMGRALPRWMWTLKYVATVAVTLTYVGFHLLLMPMLWRSGHGDYYWSLSNMGVHVLAPLLAAGSAIADLRMLLAICLLLIMAAHLLSARKDIAGLSVSILGLMYAGYLPAYFTALHQTPVSGPAMITLLLAVIGISDTGAYLIGKRLGKHKLAPKISPNKTVEGAIAALFSAAAAAAVLYALKEALHWESYPDWPLALYILVAILLSVVGQLGDLTESTLKRSAGVKDSGTLFPGHGGALDRCDAFLFGAPALYYLAFYIG